MSLKVIGVVPMEEYKLLLTFSNDEIAIFDVEPYLNDNFWAGLKDIELFLTVKVTGGSVEWQNGADFCPDELYEKSEKIGKKLDTTRIAG